MAVLFGGGLIERCGLRAELDVDGFALHFVGPSFQIFCPADLLASCPRQAVSRGGLIGVLFDGPHELVAASAMEMDNYTGAIRRIVTETVQDRNPVVN